MYLILSFSGVVISFITVAALKQLFSQQLLDVPNERSSHTQPTPRGGGLGFIISFVITSSIASLSIHPINPPLYLLDCPNSPNYNWNIGRSPRYASINPLSSPI